MSKYNNEYVKGVLKTQGTRFVNEDGQEIILHGYGIANWENVEGFMIGSAPLPVEKFKFILFPRPRTGPQPGALDQPAGLSASRSGSYAARNTWTPFGIAGRKTTCGRRTWP